MAGRPSLPAHERRRARGLALTDAELAALERLAELLGTSRNSAVVAAVAAHLETLEKRQ